MRRFLGDMHIHTCLSPCGELEMTPRRIIDRALRKGLDIIAIADHNSAENLAVAMEIALKRGITLLPAIEVTSSEEVHVLAVFETLAGAKKMQDVVYRSLPDGPGGGGRWGEQVVVNEIDEVVGFNKKLLISATAITLKALVDEIHAIGGLAIASHVDRQHFSVISQLGFIPTDIKFDAIEVTRPETLALTFEESPDMPWITSSDAHRLDDIGGRTTNFFFRDPVVSGNHHGIKESRRTDGLKELNGRPIIAYT